MTQEADVSLFIFQTGMFFMIHCTILTGFGYITIYYDGTVEGYLYLAALEHDLFIIPFSYRFQISPFCRYNTIY